MNSQRTLTIRDWHGAGKGDLNLDIVDFEIQRVSFGAQLFDRVTVLRKPDQYSSRIGLMAFLNKSRRIYSWGFSGMTIKVREFSKTGAVIARREYSFSGSAVENSLAESGFEVVTLITH